MPEPWSTVILIGLGVLVAVNLAIALFAWVEHRSSFAKDSWLNSTQVLPAPTGTPPVSAILLHGFGGTPRDFLMLAERLAGQGFRVVVPAIPDQLSTSFAYGRGSLTPDQYCDWL